MKESELVEFLRKQAWAVEATVTSAGRPQAAVIGIVVSDACELFFDTLKTSRKYENLRANPRVAFVVGWDDSQTVQLEGIADEPTGADLERLKTLYFRRFPDGRAREAEGNIAYFRVRPSWARLSDFRGAEPRIVEIPF